MTYSLSILLLYLKKEGDMYSQTLQNQTIEFFNANIMGPLKNCNGSFGICIKSENIISVTDRKTKEEMQYNSITEMMSDGWVID